MHEEVVNHVPANREIAWRPSQTYLRRSRLLGLQARADVRTLAELVTWSAADPARYWETVIRDLELDFHRPYERTLDLGNGAPWADWFVGGGFNYVANALDRHAEGARRDQLALIWEGDDGEVRKWTYQELRAETDRLAWALISLGVEAGDRVGIFLPMALETVATVLACGKIGAIYTPMFSGYGAEAVASRLRDCGATLLITADGFLRRGAEVAMKQVADAALRAAPNVNRCIVLRRTGAEIDWTQGRDIWWHEVTAAQPQSMDCVPTSADHPYMILYTSGTTGRPKGAVHVHAGFPIKAAHDLAYCFELRPDDLLFWLTDLGWMMGPWAIGGGLMLGATLMLFEGTPDYPHPDRLWRLVEDHEVTILGIAPTAVRMLMAKGDEWVHGRDLCSLRLLGSTGETWNPVPWWWYFHQVGGSRCPIINYSGGTETGGGIVSSFSTQPIKPCSFNGPIPGMAADVVSESGEPVRGTVGELVVRQPWVGMTRGFWQDPDRYLDTYWSRFPDTWVHGDWAEIDADGFWYIRGRSDDTLKIAGKRVGPAELESAAVAHPAVREAAAIGVPHEIKGETAVVFAILRSGFEHSPEIAEAIRQKISGEVGAALRPERVCLVKDLPKTRNAKIMRRVIRAAYLDLELGDISALENPQAVQEIVNSRPAALPPTA